MLSNGPSTDQIDKNLRASDPEKAWKKWIQIEELNRCVGNFCFAKGCS